MEQDYFPRGGASEKPVIQHKTFVFERRKVPKALKKKDKKTSSDAAGSKLNSSKSGWTPKVGHFHLKNTDIVSGLQSICAVHSIFQDRILVDLPYNMRAYIHSSSISNNYTKSEKTEPLTKMFYPGQLLSCKVIERPSGDKGGQNNVRFYMTTNPSAVNGNLNAGLINEHSLVQMAVSSVEDRGYMMESGIPGVMAFLPFDQASKYSKSVLGHKDLLPVGTIIWCYVVKSNESSSGAKFVEVRIHHNATFELECSNSSNILWPGCLVNSTVTKVYDDGCCQVVVDGTDIHGIVNAQLDYCRDLSKVYFVGTSIKATLMAFSPLSDIYQFSFSHLVYKPLLSFNRAYKQTCRATVDYVDKIAIYLSLDDKSFKGFVPLKGAKGSKNKVKTENADESQEVINSEFKAGDFVRVQVSKLNLLSRKYKCKIICRLDEKQYHKKRKGKKNKCEDLDSTNDATFDIKMEPDSDTEVGDIKVEDMSSDNQEDSGIDISKHPNKKSKKKKDKLKKSKKAKTEEYDSDIEIKQEPNSEDEMDQEDNPVEIGKQRKSLQNGKESTNKRKSIYSDEDSSKKMKMSFGEKGKPILSENIKKKVDSISKMSLQEVDSQFIWDATPDDLAKVTSKDIEEFEEESDEETTSKKPLSKKQKKANEIEKEKKIREKEEELLKALEEPKSADHYERLILSRPDDSRVWIKYMAFHLEATEIEKARAVGNRALKLITHRNEQDRLNIWLALLNLEHLYGTKELFKETLIEALKYNDDYKVNCKVLDMYAGSQNIVEVNSLVQRMIKQYRENVECWYVCLTALMSASMEEKARDLLQRALKSLPPKNHVTLISRFALLENSHGHCEEAQALFDNLLTAYASRIDLWFVYIDMLIKSNQMDLTRQVFERATSMKLPAKKMKSLYKKWLDFEEKHGSEESVETVRKSAVEYVEKATKEIGA